MMQYFKKLKEKREQKINDEVEKLNLQYSKLKNSCCLIGSRIFVFKGFENKNNEIIILWEDHLTPKDHNSYSNYSLWLSRYGVNIYDARDNWIKFKEQIDHFGYEIKKKENDIHSITVQSPESSSS